jgi:phage-related minor tail protein
MRGGRYLAVLASVGVLAAGCGTKVAQPGSLAAAVTRTAGQSARIAVTTTMQMQGMSVSFTETAGRTSRCFLRAPPACSGW